ncbi:MAG TPA: hypothetical protein VJ824_08590 [Bacillota bacterium]|nr:hypothetical protein [Bacillota bacterium]
MTITKFTFRFMVLTSMVGLALLIPHIPYHRIILYGHMSFGILLVGMLFWVMKTHVPKELSNPFKRGIKKWNGLKYLFYSILAISSGILQYLGLGGMGTWIYYLHFFMGIWCILVGWKHRS